MWITPLFYVDNYQFIVDNSVFKWITPNLRGVKFGCFTFKKRKNGAFFNTKKETEEKVEEKTGFMF